MSRQVEMRRATAVRYLRDAVVTFVALLLVFAAFDDITTDNATAFPVEYTILVACALWLAFLALRLVREHHEVIGTISWFALASAVWGQRAIGPGTIPGLWPEYVIATGAYLWFWILSLILLWQAWLEHSGKVRRTA